jgi:hypothetical protein
MSWLSERKESFAEAVASYAADYAFESFLAPYVEDITDSWNMNISVDHYEPKVEFTIYSGAGDELRERVRRALQVPHMDREFNESYKRYNFTGLSSLEYNGKPINVLISVDSARGCTIEKVEEVVTVPAQPETTKTVIKFVSRCHEPEAVSA